ncbi:MAG: HdeD family acid-resistance protein [Rhizobiales bacterium]|nr:HdeD family acid-resistance protein [Hyphomicrobiales bacterium]
MTNAAMTMGAIGEVRKHSGWFIALGILFLIGGVFAIAMPFIAGLTVAAVVAIVLVWLGIVEIIHAFNVKSWGGFIWDLIIGLVMLIGGISMWVNPVVATVTLTLFIAATFIAKGVFQVILGFRMRPHDGWGWMVTAGVLDLIVGLIIWAKWPISAVWAPGTLVGISLIFTGWSYIMVAAAARRLS